MKKILVVLLIITAVSVLWFLFIRKGSVETPPIVQQNVGNAQELRDEIVVTYPTQQDTIKSPVTVKGNVRGHWFFEGTAPIELVDANGNTLGKGKIHAEGEWMTEDFVPFSATLEFEQPKTTTGKLLLEKDNPSGLPENAKQLVIPITF